jgi:hypothetical protein
VQITLPENLSLDAGAQASATLQVTGAAGLMTFTLEMAYDVAVIEATAVKATPLTANCGLASDFSTPGRVGVIGTCTTPLTADGPLLDLSLTGVSNCGASGPLSIDTCLLDGGTVPCQAGGSQVTVNCSVSGRISYYSNGMPVGGATVSLLGPTTGETATDVTGSFALAGLDGGPWQVRPQKSGDLGRGISAMDAAYVLQTVVKLRSLTPEQQRACDVTGDGTISALDAALILQYTVGLITSFPVAQACGSDWLFQPTPAASSNQRIIEPQVAWGSCQPGGISWTPLVNSAAGQDFSAILFGDCTGNWEPGGTGALRVVNAALARE